MTSPGAWSRCSSTAPPCAAVRRRPVREHRFWILAELIRRASVHASHLHPSRVAARELAHYRSPPRTCSHDQRRCPRDFSSSAPRSSSMTPAIRDRSPSELAADMLGLPPPAPPRSPTATLLKPANIGAVAARRWRSASRALGGRDAPIRLPHDIADDARADVGAYMAPERPAPRPALSLAPRAPERTQAGRRRLPFVRRGDRSRPRHHQGRDRRQARAVAARRSRRVEDHARGHRRAHR